MDMERGKMHSGCEAAAVRGVRYDQMGDLQMIHSPSSTLHSPPSTFHLPMSSPDLTTAEIEAVNQVLQTPYLSLGPRIDEFEERFADYVGARHAIAVSSGTAGLHLCAIAAGVGEGDPSGLSPSELALSAVKGRSLVITTPFSFVASANCILYERAIPILVDVDERTGNIDPILVAEAVETLTKDEGRTTDCRWLPPTLRRSSFVIRRPKAILPVHAFGQPADMDPLLDVAREYNLAVIEDACEAIGAEYKGRRLGAPNPKSGPRTAPRLGQSAIRNPRFLPSTPTSR